MSPSARRAGSRRGLDRHTDRADRPQHRRQLRALLRAGRRCAGERRRRAQPDTAAHAPEALPGAQVRTVDTLSLDADAKEAIAFAVAGYATLHGWPNNVPAATGASHPAVLGGITPGANYRRLLAQVVAAPAEPVRRIENVG